MQRFLPLFLILFLPFFSSAQEIPTTQKPLITKITATWCPLCGSWGWPFFHELIDANPSDAIFLAAHPSGLLVSPEGMDFNSNLGTTGQPKFYMGNQAISVNSGNFNSVAPQVSNDITAMASQSATVGTGIEVIRNGDSFTASTNTKFFSALDGEYHLAVYVLENHVIEFQASQSANADHSFVLRSSFGGSSFGNAIATGSVEEGHEVANTLTIPIDDKWNTNNLYFAAVVWQKVDGTFNYVNGNQVQETIVNSDKEADYSAFQMDWLANDNGPMLNMNADKNYQDLRLEVYSLDGRLVYAENIDYLAKGAYIQSLYLDQAPSGSYAVKLSGKDLQKSLLLVK